MNDMPSALFQVAVTIAIFYYIFGVTKEWPPMLVSRNRHWVFDWIRLTFAVMCIGFFIVSSTMSSLTCLFWRWVLITKSLSQFFPLTSLLILCWAISLTFWPGFIFVFMMPQKRMYVAAQVCWLSQKFTFTLKCIKLHPFCSMRYESNH